MANAIMVKRGCRCAQTNGNGNGGASASVPLLPEPVETADAPTRPQQTVTLQQNGSNHAQWLIPVAVVLVLLWCMR